MKPQPRLKMLLALESNYERLLSNVRDMIELEGGKPKSATKGRHGRNGDTPTETPFAEMTKGEAVSTILKEKGELHASKIFNSMRKRGHKIASKNSLANLLSTDKRFERKGKGIWALAAQ